MISDNLILLEKARAVLSRHEFDLVRAVLAYPVPGQSTDALSICELRLRNLCEKYREQFKRSRRVRPATDDPESLEAISARLDVLEVVRERCRERIRQSVDAEVRT